MACDCATPPSSDIKNYGSASVYRPVNTGRTKDTKNKRRKLQCTSERLRLLMLEWSFKQTGKIFDKEKHKRLGCDHGEEKLRRYNHLCPKCHVIEFIRGEDYPTKTSMPLCIDNCDNCPLKRYNLQDNAEWMCVQHSNFEQVSRQLDDYISIYVRRDQMDVIQNTILTLKIKLETVKQGNAVVLCDQNWTVKVLKRLWFEKIRTSTPAKQGSTQPLNLTYGRFWMELVDGVAFMSITAHNTQRELQHIPIDSVIGATVDSSMQICLSMQSSFVLNKNKMGKPRHVSFELFFNRNFLRSLNEESINVMITLTKNCTHPSFDDLWSHALHSNDNSNSNGMGLLHVDGLHINDPSILIENTTENVFPLFSFAVSTKSLETTRSALFPAVQTTAEGSVIAEKGANAKRAVQKTARPKRRLDEMDNAMEGSTKKKQRLNNMNIVYINHNHNHNKNDNDNDNDNDNGERWIPSLPVLLNNDDKSCFTASCIISDTRQSSPLPFLISEVPSLEEATFSTHEDDVQVKVEGQQQSYSSNSMFADGGNFQPPLPEKHSPATSYHGIDESLAEEEKEKEKEEIENERRRNNENSNRNARISPKTSELFKMCESLGIENLFENLIELGCKVPSDVSNLLQNNEKVDKLLKRCALSPLMGLAVQSMMKSFVENEQQWTERNQSIALSTSMPSHPINARTLHDDIPSNPNQLYKEREQLLLEETAGNQTIEQKIEEMEKKILFKQLVKVQALHWGTVV